MKALLLWFLTAFCVVGSSWSLPVGFVDELVVEHEDPVNLEFIRYANGTYHLLVADRKGKIYLVTDPEASNPSKMLIADFKGHLCHDGSRGILGVTAHPDFDQKPWIYLYYTRLTDGRCQMSRETGAVNRFARYTMSYTLDHYTLDLSSELVLFDTSPTKNHLHNGGKAHFGKDGMIWVMTGDGGESRSVSSDPADLLGKVIRLTENGEIPPDGNAFTSNIGRCNVMGVPLVGSPPGTKCAEIWALGLRNPFRFSMDPTATDTTRFYVNDVGAAAWEEVSIGGSDYKGVHYGWGTREGPCDRESVTDCAPLPQYQDPEYWYLHDTGIGGDGSIVGGSVIPIGLWPSEYDGKYMFAEYVLGKIFLLTSSSGCRSCKPPTPDYSNTTFHSVSKPVSLEFGPYQDTQALYYTSRDKKFGAIRRIAFTGDRQNRPPVAALSSDVEYIDVGGQVNFDASLSYDPDGKSDRLKYSYKVVGEGTGYSPWTRSPFFSYTFNTAGKFRVKLRVKSKGRLKARDTVVVVVGNLPIPDIVSPIEGTKFAVGDIFTLVGNATDYDGNPLPDSSMKWEVRKHHSNHFHPFFDGVNNDLVLPAAPNPEDFYAATNSYLEIILTVDDKANKLKKTVRRNVLPRIVQVDFDSDPSGLKLTLFEQDLVMPQRVSCWENQQLSVAPYHDNSNYVFESWSDGGAEEHSINIAAAGDDIRKYVAKFRLA